MYPAKLHKLAALLLSALMLAMLFTLPAFAAPDATGNGTETEVTDGNLGDRDDDGMIEDGGAAMTDAVGNTSSGTVHENDLRDPIDAVENAATGSATNWVTVVICIVIVIALILIIVALIPRKRR